MTLHIDCRTVLGNLLQDIAPAHSRRASIKEQTIVKMKLIKSLIAVVATAAFVLPGLAHAETNELPVHYSGAIGFHNVDAPLGGRWWFAGQMVGLDFGLGFQSTPAPI
jgi:hypothetical protein